MLIALIRRHVAVVSEKVFWSPSPLIGYYWQTGAGRRVLINLVLLRVVPTMLTRHESQYHTGVSHRDFSPWEPLVLWSCRLSVDEVAPRIYQ